MRDKLEQLRKEAIDFIINFLIKHKTKGIDTSDDLDNYPVLKGDFDYLPSSYLLFSIKMRNGELTFYGMNELYEDPFSGDEISVDTLIEIGEWLVENEEYLIFD